MEKLKKFVKTLKKPKNTEKGSKCLKHCEIGNCKIGKKC
jgi:hypothetical protein